MSCVIVSCGQVCFRTFGKDLPKLAPEFNALADGSHPLFQAHGPYAESADAGKTVLDGTDGQPDMRMAMTLAGCGTWLMSYSRARCSDSSFPPLYSM